MEFIEYPKIETLYNREEKTHFVIPSAVRWPEFLLVNRWHITEKVDGTNIRIGYTPENGVLLGGRTAAAQLPACLVGYLNTTFTVDKMAAIFPDATNVILFGEGYGPKIQKGGGNYRADASFRLFDVLVGDLWLTRESVEDIAEKLGVRTVPSLGYTCCLPSSAADLACLITDSQVAREDGGAGCRAEGIVARTEPLLLNRRGQRLMWKLKFRDFPEGR